MRQLAPGPTLFPYTTLFRSLAQQQRVKSVGAGRAVEVGEITTRAASHAFVQRRGTAGFGAGDRKSTRLNSSHMSISYAVFCVKNKTAQVEWGLVEQLVSRCV